MTTPLVAWTFAMCGLVLSWGLATGLVRGAPRFGLMDAPNHRSAHSKPVPRGGGIGLIVAMALSMELLPWLVGGVPLGTMTLAAGALLLTAGVGWIDDISHLSPWIRLCVHTLSGILVAWVASEEAVTDLVPLAIPTAGVWLWWVFWTASAVNVSNFMDGIDGLIALQALIYGLFVAWAAGDAGATDVAVLGITLAAASFGFLLLNWSPATVFLGDVGAGGLGVIFSLLGLFLMRSKGWGIVHAYLPLMPLFLDELVTLVRRIRAGDSVLLPHKKHIYQRLVHGRWGHRSTSLLYGALSGLAVLWVVAGSGRGDAVFFAGATLLLLVEAFVLEAALRLGTTCEERRT